MNEILESDEAKIFFEEYDGSKVNAFNEVLADYLCGGSKLKPIPTGGRAVEKIETICKRSGNEPVIYDYCEYRHQLQKMKKEKSYEGGVTKLNKIIGTVNDDIREAYDSLYPVVQSGQGMQDYYEADYSGADYTNFDQVRIILTMPKYPATHPCYPIREDIHNTVLNNKERFKQRELDVVEAFYVYGGRTVAEVAELLNIDRPNTYRTVRTVANKIVKLEFSNVQ